MVVHILLIVNQDTWRASQQSNTKLADIQVLNWQCQRQLLRPGGFSAVHAVVLV